MSPFPLPRVKKDTAGFHGAKNKVNEACLSSANFRAASVWAVWAVRTASVLQLTGGEDQEVLAHRRAALVLWRKKRVDRLLEELGIGHVLEARVHLYELDELSMLAGGRDVEARIV